jgi:diguanylate cyclase (GGDEF)-like protein
MCVYRTVENGYELFYLVDADGVKDKSDGIEQPKNDAVSFTKLLMKDEKEIGKVEFYCDYSKKKDKKLVEIFLNKILIPFAVGFDKDIRYQDLQAKAVKDVLTGLFNREYMNETLNDKILEAKRERRPISISMLDIDYFKHINDTYGHLYGDEVLREIALLLVKNLRNSDIVIRYGGEEFLIIMPYTDEKNAHLKIDKLRMIIQEHVFSNKIKITVSAGVYQYRDEEGICDFIDEADKRLYKAKNSGRNRVV